jgi:8-oxo-dGTP pyrophosphatase MutT (NUDIX family)
MDMIWKPRVTVAAVIEDTGRFLLVEERIAGKRVYNQPAGHLEPGESLTEAVVRETLEETAWHFQPAALVGLYRWYHSEADTTYLRVTFSGRGLFHEPGRQLDEDIEGTVWLTAGEIREQGGSLRSPLVLKSIDDYLAGAAYPLALLADVE